MHSYFSTVLTFRSKFVCKIHGVCPAHQPLCVPLQALLQDTAVTPLPAAAAAPPPPPPVAAPVVRVSRVLPLLLFSKAYRLLIRVVPRSTDCFFLFESGGILTTYARARMLSCSCSNALVLVLHV